MSKITIKFPNGLDRNTFYFPDIRWKDVFDIYFCSSKIEENLIKEKFKNLLKPFFIGYPRFDLKNLWKDKIIFNKEFNFTKNKKRIVCLCKRKSYDITRYQIDTKLYRGFIETFK